MEKYQFDENLINEGWSQMNAVLEQEMPLEKKKRRAFIFWFSAVSGIAATVFLSWLTLSYLSVSGGNENKIVQESTNAPRILRPWSVVETDANVQKEDKTISITETQNYKTLEKSLQNSNSLYKKVFLKQNKNIQDLDLQHLALFYNDNIVFLNKNTVNADKVLNLASVEKNEEAKRENTAIPPIENRKKLSEIPHQNEEKTPNLEYLKTKNKGKENYQIGVFVGANTSLSTLGAIPNNSIILGIKYAKKVKKNLFEVSLFWENTSKKSAIYYAQTHSQNTSKLSIIYPFLGDIGADSLAKSNGLVPASQGNTSDLIKDTHFLSTVKKSQIGVSIAYAYRFTKRIEVNIGLAATKSFGRESYATLLNSKPNQKSYGSTTSFASSDVLPTLLADYNESKAQNYFINYDIYYNFGVSYYFTKNLKTSVLYRSGLIDLTKSNVITKKEINDFFSLQLTKYF